MAASKPTAEKIVQMAYKLAIMESGGQVEISGAFWRIVDAADYTGKEHKRGQVVLIERRMDGKEIPHWNYWWPSSTAERETQNVAADAAST